MKRLGIIGGLGPLATAYFMELLTKMTNAVNDQDHLQVLVHSNPGTPDRTAYILGQSGDTPLPHMIALGQSLEQAGAELLAIPCITAHYFHEELQNAFTIPLIHLLKEISLLLVKNGILRAGIMATDGTVKSRLFQEHLKQQGILPILPDELYQRYVMELIYDNVKAGKPVNLEKFKKAAQNLQEKGANIIILGCTELSLIKRDYSIGSGYLDAMEVLAAQSIRSCGKDVKQDYEKLI